MGIDTAIEYADQLLYERTGKHLSDLQSYIIQQSWQGKTYGQVATLAGYSEGHIKDVASQLWKLLSEALGERITKGNLRSRLKNRIKRTLKSAPGSATVIAGIRGVQAQLDWKPQDKIQRDRQDACPTNIAFLGRQSALHTLQELAQTHQIIVVQGEGGIGKTTLAQQYCQQFDQVLELLMAKEAACITPIESVVEEWLRQHFNEEPGREFGVTLSRLKHHLQTKSVGILIDNLEPALDGNGQFIAAHRHYVELLRVLAASKATVLITSRDRLCEPGVKVHHYRLPGLTVEAWQQFFFAHSIETTAPAPADILMKMHRAYGGNAKAMEILCAAAVEDFEGDLSAYWENNNKDLLGTADLRNLVGSQVNRLAELDADAYRVFCRLGCYRYQDQSQLKVDAIAALMWDIAPTAQKQTLNSLRDRSLLECRKGHYWLHPVSRAEAIARLRQSSDWQRANQAAADYWSRQPKSIVSVNDALQALEAFYHLIAIHDYDGAAAVLLKSRHNQWRQFLPLASSLYRMGLLQPVTSAITQVLPHVRTSRSELNNILGDVYWITGEVHSAIACQQQTLAGTAQRTETLIAQKSLPTAKRDSYYLKMLTVDAHLSIGLYHIDLWELSQAAQQFEKVIALAQESPHQAWADKATVGLALVKAHLGDVPMAA
ncbi:MAG: NB-ARC domain-containing protein, partial [Cyanobacteria bacterium J06560_2]